MGPAFQQEGAQLSFCHLLSKDKGKWLDKEELKSHFPSCSWGQHLCVTAGAAKPSLVLWSHLRKTSDSHHSHKCTMPSTRLSAAIHQKMCMRFRLTQGTTKTWRPFRYMVIASPLWRCYSKWYPDQTCKHSRNLCLGRQRRGWQRQQVKHYQAATPSLQLYCCSIWAQGWLLWACCSMKATLGQPKALFGSISFALSTEQARSDRWHVFYLGTQCHILLNVGWVSCTLTEGGGKTAWHDGLQSWEGDGWEAPADAS